jgi:RNA 2',3'-cyclic 3'-phosphodiesterase
MRLFIALDINDSIRERIAQFMEGVRGFAPDARWVHAESLHVTLKFIGEKPESALEQIKQTLRTIFSGAIEIGFRDYGFFPSPKSARVFWVGIQAAPDLAALASAVDGKMAALGIPKEEHAFSPHLTLARAAGRSGSPRRRNGDGHRSSFQHLQEKLAALPKPDFGTLVAREFFLYQSQLSPKGSKYTKLARFDLT